MPNWCQNSLSIQGEPTDIANIAEQNGVPTLQAYFSDDVARDIVAEHGGKSREDADAYVRRLADDRRYLRDVY